jgi:hypothetical protein
MCRVISFLSQFSLSTIFIGREGAPAQIFTHESFRNVIYT